ncbi:MAG TPA: GntR family transcriptional regulator [Candidatus Saccharimonadales bacterium]|nr:GntR family transcriptional regulator [Candidatus Saccharimonadales bacterium]
MSKRSGAGQDEAKGMPVAVPTPAGPTTATSNVRGGNEPAPRLPRYRSIAVELTRRIAAQDYEPGSLLPSESDLATEFGVTRMTVRQALAGLASQGVIERRHGHGTIVAPIKLQRQAERPIGLAEELLARGVTPGSRVLKIEEIRPSAEARSSLWIGPVGTAYRLRRLRFADDVLIGLQESLIPARHAPGLDQVDFTNESLTRLLRERHGLAATSADLTIEAMAADRAVAATLDLEPGEPVLRSTRISYLDDGRPLERTIGWFIGTRYSYHVRQGHPG